MEQQDKKISQMPPLQTVSGDEIVPVVKSGGNYSTLVSQIVALARQTMVEAQAGKGLSANDFTDALKAKLEGLSNYDDTHVRSLIAAVSGRLDTILGDGASSAIDTFNEIEAFLAGITDTQTLTGLLAEQKQTITAETDTKLAGKVDKVSGKGLSANDYTDDEKAKLGALLGNEQFGLLGMVKKTNGQFFADVSYSSSDLLPLNRNYDLVFVARAYGDAASVSFYTADGTWISSIQKSTIKETILPKSEFPTNAAFVRFTAYTPEVSTCYYRNGETIESREGGVSEAIQAAITAAVDETLIAEATAAGAVYNRATGYFELNTLTDITAGQMRLILRNTQRPPYNVFASTAHRAKLRTNDWQASPQSTHDVQIQSMGVFSGWVNAEVINLNNGYTDYYATKINGYDTFKACLKLHTILGDFSFGNNATNYDTFASCLKLRSFRLYGVNYNIDLKWSPSIDFETLQFMVNNALDTNAKTITLHPDAFARLTDELVEAATAKQITFATTN